MLMFTARRHSSQLSDEGINILNAEARCQAPGTEWTCLKWSSPLWLDLFSRMAQRRHILSEEEAAVAVYIFQIPARQLQLIAVCPESAAACVNPLTPMTSCLVWKHKTPATPLLKNAPTVTASSGPRQSVSHQSEQVTRVTFL